MIKCILFDLDGTITESGPGIIKSVQYALEKMGREADSEDELRVFIGPPLIDQFMAYCNISKEEANQAVVYYRQRYATTGIFENSLYPGVEELLAVLKERGYILGVASSKPEKYVRQILEHFNLDKYFDEIVGATMDEKMVNKSEVIEEALRRLALSNQRENILMVGDKEHDVLGARQAGVSCVAVAYGYGTMEELKEAKPLTIVDSVAQLKEYLMEM